MNFFYTYGRQLGRLFTLVVLVCPWPAYAYEAELATLTKKLTLQLEALNQQSATVIDFTDLQGASTELGKFLAQELSDDLVSSAKHLSVIDRTDVQTLLRENKLSMDGLINPATSKRLGNLIGIDTVISGTVTPIGEKIRLSVRAINVETGRIVASQSASLPSEGLGDLFNHGVSNAVPGMASAQPTSSGADARARFRGDSLVMTARDARIGYAEISANFTIENKSGIGIGIGVVMDSTALSSCTVTSLTGLGYFTNSQLSQIRSQANPLETLAFLPVNGKATGAVTFSRFPCPLKPGMVADLSTSLIIAAGKEVFVFPASASVQVQ